MFKKLYNKVIKPVGKKIAKNPTKAIEAVQDSLKYLNKGEGLYLSRKASGIYLEKRK